MRDILCTSPGCQTTAGCQCSRVGRITQLTYGTPAPANDGYGTVIVDVAHYERVIRDLQRENQALRTELAEAKIAIGWARDAGLEEAAKACELEAERQKLLFPQSLSNVVAWGRAGAYSALSDIAASIRGLAATSPTIADPVKEGGRDA